MKKYIINEEEKKRILNLHKNEAKKLMSEAVTAPEPVKIGSATIKVMFQKDGDTNLTQNEKTIIKNFIRPKLTKSLGTIKKFYNNPKFTLPKFITIGAGTTSTGSYAANENVAKKRIEVVKKVVNSLLIEMGLNDEMIMKILTTNSDYTYNPTRVDSNIFDRKRTKPMDKERFAYIKVNELATLGLDTEGIGGIEDKLRIARGYNVDPDEVGIANAICKLRTYSDIKDLNYALREYGGLQSFINQTITDGMTSMGSDTDERNTIKGCLNSAAKRSGKSDVAAIAGDTLTIIL